MNQAVGDILRISASGGFRRRLRKIHACEHFIEFASKHLRLMLLFSFGARGMFSRAIPGLTTRYFRPYLGQSFNLRDGRRSFVHHYDIISKRMDSSWCDRVLRESILLWSEDLLDRSVSIELSANRVNNGEGELILTFYLGREPVQDLSFSIIPGGIVTKPDEDALFIGRIQGVRGQFANLRAATKACGDIVPASLLVSAAVGIAEALSLSRLCGVTTTEQLSARWGISQFDYDGFWREQFGASEGEWFSVRLPLKRKPLMEIPATHRRRAKRKRAFKDRLTAQVRREFEAALRAEPEQPVVRAGMWMNGEGAQEASIE